MLTSADLFAVMTGIVLLGFICAWYALSPKVSLPTAEPPAPKYPKIHTSPSDARGLRLISCGSKTTHASEDRGIQWDERKAG